MNLYPFVRGKTALQSEILRPANLPGHRPLKGLLLSIIPAGCGHRPEDLRLLRSQRSRRCAL